MTLPGRKTTVFLLLAASLAALVYAWDWNWFREPLERHLRERSQREVSIGDLHIGFDGLEPTVRLRKLRVANAPWAQATGGKPFAVAGEASFTFSLRSLSERRPVVSRMLLVDADVSLERNADGLRNWRLRNPDDRSPGKFKFLRLEAHHSRLRFVHHGIGLDVQTAADDLPAAIEVESGGPITSNITFSGTYRGGAFSGTAATARVLSFLETGEAFALRGAATSGKTRLEADGRVADLFRLGMVDAELALSGPSLSDLQSLLPQAWPATAAYTVKGPLKKDHGLWHFPAVRADIGGSDVSGDVRYNDGADPPLLDATLSSDTTRLRDLLPPGGAGKPKGSTGPLVDNGLQRFDARVSLKVKTLHVPAVPPLTQVRVTARLDNGLLDITPIHLETAGGQLQGLLSIDGREKVPTARAELSWRNLRLERLLPPLPDGAEATGPLSGEVKLASRGTTLDALIGNLSGRGSAHLRGGRLSASLDAKLALNGGQLLRAKVADTPDVPIHCARVDVDLRDGHGDVHPVLLDTAKTRIDGRGQVDLTAPSFSLVLTPQPKDTALLSLKQSIGISGNLDDAKVSLVSRQEIEATGGCDPVAAARPVKPK